MCEVSFVRRMRLDRRRTRWFATGSGGADGGEVENGVSLRFYDICDARGNDRGHIP
jgi:hypothetical protein